MVLLDVLLRQVLSEGVRVREVSNELLLIILDLLYAHLNYPVDSDFDVWPIIINGL